MICRTLIGRGHVMRAVGAIPRARGPCPLETPLTPRLPWLAMAQAHAEAASRLSPTSWAPLPKEGVESWPMAEAGRPECRAREAYVGQPTALRRQRVQTPPLDVPGAEE